MKTSAASGFPREKTVFLRVDASPHAVQEATASRSTGSERGGLSGSRVSREGAMISRIAGGDGGFSAKPASGAEPAERDPAGAELSGTSSGGVTRGANAAKSEWAREVEAAEGTTAATAAAAPGSAGLFSRRSPLGIPVAPESSCHSR